MQLEKQVQFELTSDDIFWFMHLSRSFLSQRPHIVNGKNKAMDDFAEYVLQQLTVDSDELNSTEEETRDIDECFQEWNLVDNYNSLQAFFISRFDKENLDGNTIKRWLSKTSKQVNQNNIKFEKLLAHVVVQFDQPPLIPFKERNKDRKSINQDRIFLWEIIRAVAAQRIKEKAKTIDILDVWYYCQQHWISITGQSFKNACQGLESNSLFSVCFNLFDFQKIMQPSEKEVTLTTSVLDLPLIIWQKILEYTVVEQVKIDGEEDKEIVYGKATLSDIARISTLGKRPYFILDNKQVWKQYCKSVGCSEENLEKIETLIQRSKQPIRSPWRAMAVSYQQHCQHTSQRQLTQTWQWLCLSMDADLIELAIQENMFDKHTKDANDVRPVHLLALCGSVPSLQVLKKYKFDLKAEDNTNSTITQYQALGGNTEKVEQAIYSLFLPSSSKEMDNNHVHAGNYHIFCQTKEGITYMMQKLSDSMLESEKKLDRLKRAGVRLQITAHIQSTYAGTKGFTEAQYILNYLTNEKYRRYYLKARGVTVCDTATIITKDGISESLSFFYCCNEQTLLDYIKLRGKTLKDTMFIKDYNGKAELEHLSRSSLKVVLAYYDAVKSELKMSELMFVMKFAAKEQHIKYLQGIKQSIENDPEAREEFIKQAIKLRAFGNTELVYCSGYASPEALLEYIHLRGDSLQQSAHLMSSQDGKNAWSEVMYVFRTGTPDAIHAYIAYLDKTFQKTAVESQHSEAFLLFNRNIPALNLAYIEARGESFKKTACFRDKDGDTEAMALFSYCNYETVYNNLNMKKADPQLKEDCSKAQLAYLKARGNSLLSTHKFLNKKGSTEAMKIFRYGSPEAQLEYIKIRGDTLKDTASFYNDINWTEAMTVFRNGTPEVQLAYIKARGETLKHTAQLRNNNGWSEVMAIFRYGSPAAQLAYIQYCGDVLKQQTFRSVNEGTPAILLFKHGKEKAQLAYIKQLGDTLNESKAGSDDNGLHEAMAVFRYCSEQVQLAYLLARSDSLKESACLTDNDGRTEAFYIFKYGSLKIISTYLNIVGDVVNESAIKAGEKSFSEAIEIFIKKDPKLTLDYVNIRGKSLNQTALVTTKGGVSEGMSIFTYGETKAHEAYIKYQGEVLCHSASLVNEHGETEAMCLFSSDSPAAQNAYIEILGSVLAKTAKRVKKSSGKSEAYYAFHKNDSIVQLAYINACCKQESHDVKNHLINELIATQTEKSSTQALQYFIHEFGLCLPVNDPEHKLNKKELFDNAVVIGMTINGNAVSRKTPGFEKAMTNKKELSQFINGMSGPQYSLACSEIYDKCQQLKLINPNDIAMHKQLDAVIETIDSLINIMPGKFSAKEFTPGYSSKSVSDKPNSANPGRASPGCYMNSNN